MKLIDERISKSFKMKEKDYNYLIPVNYLRNRLFRRALKEKDEFYFIGTVEEYEEEILPRLIYND